MDEYTQKLINRQDEIIAELKLSRRLEVNNFLAHEKSKDKLMRIKRDKIIQIANDPAVSETKDPRTGKVNKDWMEWLVERRLEQDADFIVSLGEFYESQQEYVGIQAQVLNLAQELEALNARFYLLASSYGKSVPGA